MATPSEIAEIQRQQQVQKELEQRNIQAQIQAKFQQQQAMVNQQNAQSQADYNKQMTDYLNKMSAQGFRPVFDGNQLTGFEDINRSMSIPLANMGSYINKLNTEIAAKNEAARQAQFVNLPAHARQQPFYQPLTDYWKTLRTNADIIAKEPNILKKFTGLGSSLATTPLPYLKESVVGYQEALQNVPVVRVIPELVPTTPLGLGLAYTGVKAYTAAPKLARLLFDVGYTGYSATQLSKAQTPLQFETAAVGTGLGLLAATTTFLKANKPLTQLKEGELVRIPVTAPSGDKFVVEIPYKKKEFIQSVSRMAPIQMPNGEYVNIADFVVKQRVTPSILVKPQSGMGKLLFSSEQVVKKISTTFSKSATPLLINEAGEIINNPLVATGKFKPGTKLDVSVLGGKTYTIEEFDFLPENVKRQYLDQFEKDYGRPISRQIYSNIYRTSKNKYSVSEVEAIKIAKYSRGKVILDQYTKSLISTKKPFQMSDLLTGKFIQPELGKAKYVRTGKSTTRTSLADTMKLLVSTDTFELYGGKTNIRDITLPKVRASSKGLRQMESLAYIKKEPITFPEESGSLTQNLISVQKPSTKAQTTLKTVIEKIIPKPVNRKPVIPKISPITKKLTMVSSLLATPKAAQSLYYGKGMYERTEGGLFPGQLNIQQQVGMTKSLINTKQESVTQSKTQIKEIQKFIQSINSDMLMKQLSVQKIMTRQIVRQQQRQLPRLELVSRQIVRQVQRPMFPSKFLMTVPKPFVKGIAPSLILSSSSKTKIPTRTQFTKRKKGKYQRKPTETQIIWGLIPTRRQRTKEPTPFDILR